MNSRLMFEFSLLCVTLEMEQSFSFVYYSDDGGKQPPHFSDIQEFIDFIRAHPKKGTSMSHFTVDRLYYLWDEYKKKDLHEKDPVGHFVSRNAQRLGFQFTGELEVHTYMHIIVVLDPITRFATYHYT